MPKCAGVLDEKAAATQALGLYAKHTLAGFAPFIEPALAVLLRMAAYFHDDVREQAYEALSFLVLATDKAFPSPTPGADVRRPFWHAQAGSLAFMQNVHSTNICMAWRVPGDSLKGMQSTP